MDEFFHVDVPGSDFDFNCWYYDDPGEMVPIARTSAFVPYTEVPEDRIRDGEERSTGNMNKRIIGFLQNVSARPGRMTEFDRQRGFRHMLSERSRRERQKHSYDALLSQLPCGTKNDKNSIVQSAAKEIQELNRVREDLLRRNQEMSGGEVSTRRGARTNVKVRVANPTSGTDSLLVVLKCLQNLGEKTSSIRAEFSEREFSAIIEIENEKKEAAEVEKAIQSALQEGEMNQMGE